MSDFNQDAACLSRAEPCLRKDKDGVGGCVPPSELTDHNLKLAGD